MILETSSIDSDKDSESEVIKVSDYSEIEYDPLISKIISEPDQVPSNIVVLDGFS